MPERAFSPYAERYKWRFEAFHPALECVMPAIKRFATDVIEQRVQPYWLSILGPSGIGKTLALRQLFWMLSRNDHLWPIPTGGGGERMAQCAHIIPGKDLTDWAAPCEYGRYDLLYVEDIGSGAFGDRGSGAVLASRIAELLSYRDRRWTLLCANMDRRAIAEKLDPRIASRLKRDGSVMLQLPDDVPDFNG